MNASSRILALRLLTVNKSAHKVNWISSRRSLTHDALSDTFGRHHNYLRISLTERCNLRCTYCMPAEGVSLTPVDNLMTLEEQKRAIAIFAALGVSKIRFTGGEPTLNKSLSELIRHARSETNIESVGITSNGLVLKNQLNTLIDAGLTSANISLDTLIPDKFAAITRRDKKGFYKVLSTIYAACSRKELSVKINCVLMRDRNDDELANFIALTKDDPIDCRFIEMMPFDGNSWVPSKMLGYYEVLDKLKAQGIALQREPSLDAHDTTKWYRVPGHRGRVGFITTMSSHFCAGCNRLRITADGKLKVCLFGDEGLHLSRHFREGASDGDIINLIGAAVKRKKESLGGHGDSASLAAVENRPMILIGG